MEAGEAREIMVGTGDHFVCFGEDLIPRPAPPGATKTRWPWGGLPQPVTWYQIWIPDWMLDIGGTTPSVLPSILAEWTHFLRYHSVKATYGSLPSHLRL